MQKYHCLDVVYFFLSYGTTAEPNASYFPFLSNTYI